MTQTLGTLKAGDISFDPELPPEKLQAIEEMVGGQGWRGWRQTASYSASERNNATGWRAPGTATCGRPASQPTHMLFDVRNTLQGFGVLDKALFVFDKPFW